MNLHNSVRFLIAVFITVTPAWSQTTSVIDVHRGINIVGLDREYPTLATIEDLCVRTDSPFAAIAQGNRWQTIFRDSTQARQTRLEGNHAYVLRCSQPRSIPLTGSAWSTDALRIRPQAGLTLFVHQRPDATSASDLINQFRVSALLTVSHNEGGIHWRMIAFPGLVVGSAPLERGVVYGLMSPTTMPLMVLPNSNQLPVAIIDGVPVESTVGTTLTFVSRSSDPDDRLENLREHWNVRGDGKLVAQSTDRSLTITACNAQRMTVEYVVNDGLSQSVATQSITLIAPTTTLQQIQTPLGPFGLNVFGILGQLPRVSLTGGPGFPIQPTGYQITQEERGIDMIGGARAIGPTRIIGYGNVANYIQRDEQGNIVNVPLTLSVKAGESATADLLIEATVIDGEGNRIVFPYYAFTESTPASSVMGKGVVQWWRDWTSWLGETARRFTPVSLVNLASDRVGYGFTQVHPEKPLARRTPVFQLHGFDVRSEFAPFGQTLREVQHHWDPFFGTASDSPVEIAPNIPVLEKDFCFFLLTYPTTRSITEVSARLAELYAQTIPEDAEKGIVLAYSEGGVVDVAWENQMVRGKRIGDRIKYRVGIAVPYHGSSVATALTNRYFDARFFTRQVMPRAAWPLLQYGVVPPSDGLRDLRYDASWKTADGRIAYPTLNPTLSDLHSRDAFAKATNVVMLAGATEDDLPFPDPEMELARTAFSTGTEREYSDAVAWTESTIPRDKFGDSKGDTDEFFGWRVDGTFDRVGLFWGLDHLQMFTHPDVICALHQLLAQVRDRSNHPPVDETPSVITLDVGQRSVALSPLATATDPDGDAFTNAWTFWRTWPDEGRAQWDAASATLQITGPCSVVMSHVVRDGKGSITHKFVIVYRPMPPVDPLSPWVPKLGFFLNPTPDRKVRWAALPSGSVSQNWSSYDLWIDPRYDKTKIPHSDSRVYGAYRWWSGRKVYGAYQGKGINNGPILFSNIGVGEAVTVHLLDR